MKSDLKYLLIIIKPTEFTLAEFLLYKARNQQSEKVARPGFDQGPLALRVSALPLTFQNLYLVTFDIIIRRKTFNSYF